MNLLSDAESNTPADTNFTLERDGPGLLCRFSAQCSAEDFYQAVLTVQEHPQFSRLTYCIFDMAVVRSFDRGSADLHMILAHIAGSVQTNPRLKLAIISEAPDVLTFARWLATHSDRAIGYFHMMNIARTWTDISPWITANFD